MRQRRWVEMAGSVLVCCSAAGTSAAETTSAVVQHEQTVFTHAAAPAFSVRLVAPEKLARQRSVLMQVTAPNIELVEPTQASGAPREGQGHLHYQVDQGPIIDTANPVLTLHALAFGRHTVAVEIAGNDHRPLGPPQVLVVTIPEAAE